MSLDEIYSIYESMLESANKNRWDKVQQDESVARRKIKNYFDDIENQALSDKDIELLKNIENINNSLLKMAAAVKKDFLATAKDSLKQTRAVQKYERHSNI